MKIEASVSVMQTRQVGTKCDVCGKQADVADPKGWHQFHHMHSEWGNDSSDSVEYFDVCSAPCYAVQMAKSLKEMKDHAISAEIDGKDYAFAAALVDQLNTKP